MHALALHFDFDIRFCGMLRRFQKLLRAIIEAQRNRRGGRLDGLPLNIAGKGGGSGGGGEVVEGSGAEVGGGACDIAVGHAAGGCPPANIGVNLMAGESPGLGGEINRVPDDANRMPDDANRMPEGLPGLA